MDMLAGAAALEPGGEFAQPTAGFLAIAEEPCAQFASQTTSVAETLQSDSQEPPQLTEKQQIAHSIKPEQVKKGWLGSTKSKPGLMELREELQRRWHSDEPEWTFPICGQSRR